MAIRVWQTCERFGSSNYTDGKWSGEISRHRITGTVSRRLPLSEIARVLVRFNYVTRFIVNANHCVIAVLSVARPASDLPPVRLRLVWREENHANELTDTGGELKRDAEKEDPEKIQGSHVNELAEDDAGADDRHAVINVAITAHIPDRVWRQLRGGTPAHKNEGQEQKSRECAAPAPDRYRRGFNGEQENSEETAKQRDRGIGEEKPQPKLVDGRPLMERTPAESDHDSGKSGQCHRNLRGRTKSLAWFHRYCFYQTRRIMITQ
jgi:hypothetical protein